MKAILRDMCHRCEGREAASFTCRVYCVPSALTMAFHAARCLLCLQRTSIAGVLQETFGLFGTVGGSLYPPFGLLPHRSGSQDPGPTPLPLRPLGKGRHACRVETIAVEPAALVILQSPKSACLIN